MSTASFTIIPATAGDADTITAFNTALARASEGVTLDPAVVAEGVRTALSDRDRCRYFLAHTSDAVAGQMMLTTEWSDWRNGWFWWIQSVYVATPFRRQGVFRALYGYVAALARREPDVCGLRLYVDESNHAGCATYDRVGMTRTRYLLYEDDWSGAAGET